QLLWSGPSVTKAAIPSSVMTSASAGLPAPSSPATSLTPSAVVRLDNTVNFSWGTGSPDSRVPVDNFSARWTGKIKPINTATYTFYTDVAGGVRLWVNGQQLVNNWTLHSLATNTGKITLAAGTSYDIKMEYQVGTQSAVAKLSWSASFAKSIVPQSVLGDRSNDVTPVAPNAPAAPSGLVATPGDGQVNLSWVAPPPMSGAPVTDYIVQYRQTGTTAWTAVDEGSIVTTATITGLTDNNSYDFTVTAVNSVGQGPPSAVTSATPTPQLLPDPGFESGNGGWIAFKIGTLSRVTSPVHGGSDALRVASPSASASLVGLTQNAVISNSVAGRSYTASCYVQPTSGSLNVSIRWLEYTQDFSSVINLQNNLTSALPLDSWTNVAVTSTAVHSGERMIPQIYSSKETSTNGSLLYDDCSVTAASGTTSPGAPSAPAGVSATAGVASAAVSFGAPNANGSPITGYTVTSNPGNLTATGTSSPI